MEALRVELKTSGSIIGTFSMSTTTPSYASYSAGSTGTSSPPPWFLPFSNTMSITGSDFTETDMAPIPSYKKYRFSLPTKMNRRTVGTR